MIIAFCLVLAAAQDTARAQRLELGDVYRELQAANPRVHAARALASARDAQVTSARRPPDPQLQFGFMNYAVPALAPMAPIGMAQLQFMQMLPVGGKLRLSARIAESRAGAAGEQARDALWDARARAAMVFYELYAIDRGLEVDRETLRLLWDILRTTEAMYRVGEGRQTDVLRAQVEIARMSQDTLRMATMRIAMAARLNALLNREPDAPVASPLVREFPEPPSTAVLLQAALGGRPMLRAGVRDVAAAGDEVTRARREIWPDVTIGLQLAQQGGATGTERMGSLMLGASVPVFARSRQLRMRQEAAAMREMAEAELADMRAETRAAVAESHAALTRSRSLRSMYLTTIIPQARATVASALAAYRVGSVDFMTLLDGQMAVARYRREVFRLETDEGKAWAELEMLTGSELVDALGGAGAAGVSRTDGRVP